MEKQFFCLAKRGIIFLVFFFSAHQFFAQAQGAWVVQQLPDVLPTNWSRAVGENCLIYVGENDTVVYAYDLSSGQWHEHMQATELPWLYPARASRDVAMVYTDSIVIAYSAVLQSFFTLSYQGTLLNSTVSSIVKLNGCTENAAYFVTDQYFYAFDAETGQWYSHQMGAFGTIDNKYAYEKPGYILVKLTDNSDNEKLMTYSISNRSFLEWNYTFSPAIETLDYGFVAWELDSGNPENEFFGCYSALHNSWSSYNENDFSAVATSGNAESLQPRTVFMFRVSTEIIYPDYQHTFYIFNTLYSDACVVSRATNDDYNTHSFSTGAQTAVISFINVNDNNLEILAYRSDTHSATPFEISPLYVEQDVGWHECGGKIYMGNDFDQVIGGYPNGQHMVLAPMPADYEISYKWGRDIKARDDWGIMLIEDKDADSAYVYSYNINNADNLTHFITEWGNYSFMVIDYNSNVAGLLAATSSGHKLFLYSPVFDQWTQKEFGPNSLYFTTCRDFIYYRETNSNRLCVFDGVTNQELDLGYNSGLNYTYPGEDFLVAYTSENKFVSYSAITRTSNEYAINRTAYIRGDQSIWTSEIGNTGILTYNSIADSFIPLTFSDNQGLLRNINVGGETALILTTKGYLLAFDPYKDISTAIDNENLSINAPAIFRLDQNYPNPFNSNSVIKYSILKTSNITLKIFNVLGLEIETLVNEEKPVGTYELKWNAANLPSGVYFYRLQAGNFVQTRKMILTE